MNRLTTKISNANNFCKYELKNAKYRYLFDLTSNKRIEDYVDANLTIAIDKLGQLEDIEEELGIDLLTLFKALKQDYIYFKHHYGWSNAFMIKKEYIQGLKYYIDDNTFVFWTDDCGKEHLVYIKDYLKKWALTREELLDE